MFTVGDTIRLPHYKTAGEGRFRVWKIVGVHLGGTNQEDTYALMPLDVNPNEPIHVPCIMLDGHPHVQRV